MKVVFFSSTGHMTGGAVMCLKQILLYCRCRNIEPYVVTSGHGTFEKFLDDNNIRHEAIRAYDWLRPLSKHGGFKNTLRWKLKMFLATLAERRMKAILQREAPNVFHLNVIYNSCGAKSAKELNIPVVWHLREFAEIDKDTPFFYNSQKAYSLIGKSNKIITVSDCLLNFYSKFLPVEKMVRIYDGIKMPPLLNKQRHAHDKFTITLSGGAKVKGHIDIIMALSILKNKGYSNLRLQVAGSFADKDYLNHLKRKVAELNLEDKVKFLGQQSDMTLIWESTDLAVVCSRYESFGLSAVEFMSNGIPLICATTTGSLEVTNNGTYCQTYTTRNVNQLADCIINVYNDYRKYASKAYKVSSVVHDTFNIERSCEALIDIFKNVSAS